LRVVKLWDRAEFFSENRDVCGRIEGKPDAVASHFDNLYGDVPIDDHLLAELSGQY
jgi:hypothetical protein